MRSTTLRKKNERKKKVKRILYVKRKERNKTIYPIEKIDHYGYIKQKCSLQGRKRSEAKMFAAMNFVRIGNYTISLLSLIKLKQQQCCSLTTIFKDSMQALPPDRMINERNRERIQEYTIAALTV